MLFMWWQSCSCHSCEGNVTITIHTIAPIHQSLHNPWDPNHSTTRLFNAVHIEDQLLRNVTLSGRRKNERKGRSDTKQCVLDVWALIGVAMACMAVANIVKSSLGPVGLDKMLVHISMLPLSV